MELSDILRLYDAQLRRDMVYPDMHKEVVSYGGHVGGATAGGQTAGGHTVGGQTAGGRTAVVVRFTRPAPGANFVLYSNLRGADVEGLAAIIAAEKAYFAGLGQPFNWKVYAHDYPADLKERLWAQGFELSEAEAVMVLEIEQAPSALLEPVKADVRPVTDREGLKDVVAVLEGTYGHSYEWVYGRLGSHLEVPGYLNVYAAYVDDQPASAAWVYFHAGTQFASLWGGATLEAFRKQGLYSALLAARLQEARRRGFRFVTVDAGEMSRPVLKNRGFQVMTYATDCDLPV